MNIPFRVVAVTMLAAWIPVQAQELKLKPEELTFFENKVRPLLAKHCYECHSRDAGKIKGGLLLDSRDGWMLGGDSGEVIEPGKPQSSLVMESVLYGNPDLQMPPKYKLAEDEVEILERWIAIGAPDPRTTEVVAAPKSSIDYEKGRQHWAFQPVKNPAKPSVKNSAWVKDDLDRFILAPIEKAGIQPAPDADRFTLIRRATLDLTGLPPTVEDINAFVHDPAADDAAFANVVDRLLASPAFGERWGRHWLDVARYADSVGRTRNVPFPYAWRYRNYVIDAFNADKPYDEFIREQVAGDLLPSEDKAEHDRNVIATGYLALGSMDLNERDREQFLLDRVDDQVDTLGRSIMALTTGCARCHDHKFDPIAQTEYYALAGIFSSTQTLSGQTSRGKSKSYFHPDLLASLGDTPAPKPEVEEPKVSKQDQERIAELQARLLDLAQQARKGENKAELKAKAAKVRRELNELKADSGASGAKKKGTGGGERVDPEAALAMSVKDGEVADLALRVRGEPDMRGDSVPRGFPVVLSFGETASLPENESGRLELARWLTDPSHPLTARVMVNRVWSHLFGRGIVPTVDNFGFAGEEPTHPELLDHLATRFVAEGWSVKSLLRDIVLSHAYRVSSQPVTANLAADESNRLFWRMNLRRVEAEVIRDSLLAAGGDLRLDGTQGAPFQGMTTADLGKRGGISSDYFERPVRSVYLPVLRSRLPEMFTVFDFAEPDQVNGQRDVTTVAPQALFMLNNEFVVEVSERAAKRVLDQDVPDQASRIRYAYAYTLGRNPDAAELKRAADYLGTTPAKDQWAGFMQALYSSAEFRYVR